MSQPAGGSGGNGGGGGLDLGLGAGKGGGGSGGGGGAAGAGGAAGTATSSGASAGGTAGTSGSGGSGSGGMTPAGMCARSAGSDADCAEFWAEEGYTQAYACPALSAAAQLSRVLGKECASVNFVAGAMYGMCCQPAP